MSALAGKIAKASIEVGAFRADKKNQDQNYAYISADQVLSRAGDALAKQGIAVIPNTVKTTLTTVERPNKSPRIDAAVEFSMSIRDEDSEITASWIGFGSDYMTPDKAIYKAITSGHKYFLMKLLNIGIGNEDSEHERSREEIAGARAALAALEDGSAHADEGLNPDPVPDKAWSTWEKLLKRADAVQINHGNPDRATITFAELKIVAAELLAAVEQAEAQEIAVTEPQE
jgi:hypothetical protein